MQVNSQNVADASAILEAAASVGLRAEVIENPRFATPGAKLNAEQADLMLHVGDTRRGLGEMVAEIADTDADKRWLGIAATHLQQGMMAIERAIAGDKTVF